MQVLEKLTMSAGNKAQHQFLYSQGPMFNPERASYVMLTCPTYPVETVT